MREFTELEKSAVCSNLAGGCDKQYKPEEGAYFREIAEYFREISPKSKPQKYEELLEKIQKDIEINIPSAKETASKKSDRGALRALTWSEKVSMMNENLISRYIEEGESMLKDFDVYVCPICGFISIGHSPPKICPVCSVQDWKFEKIEEA